MRAALLTVLERARQLLAEPGPEPPADYSMNSWLNELPGLHPSGKHYEVVIHPDDAAALGINDGDRVKVFSPVGAIELAAAVNERPRRGAVCHRPRLGLTGFRSERRLTTGVVGANRNLLIDGGPLLADLFHALCGLRRAVLPGSPRRACGFLADHLTRTEWGWIALLP
jgi:formate dehydrogenase